MFARIPKPVNVDCSPVVNRRQVEVPSESGIDVVYTDVEEPLPPYDAYTVESLSAAGIPLQAVNPAVLDSVDIASLDSFLSKASKAPKAPKSFDPVPSADPVPEADPVPPAK